MLYLYLSLHKPVMIACLDLPVSVNQRSSPWSRHTRRELRRLARSLIASEFRRKGDGHSSVNDHDPIVAVGYEDLERRLIDRLTIHGACRSETLRAALTLHGCRA